MKKHELKKHECHSMTCLQRHKYHKLIHKIHYKRRISYRTLFYMKEYGPNSHVASTIVKQSLKILLLASIISTIGGIHLKAVQDNFIAIIPLVILLPALADMIGDFATIASSKFTTMLYLGRVKGNFWKSPHIHDLLHTLMSVAIISSVYIGVVSYLIAAARGYGFALLSLAKIVAISMIATVSLVLIIMLVSMAGGVYIFKKKEDPNNFLIPISTSIADLGSLALFSLLVTLFF